MRLHKQKLPVMQFDKKSPWPHMYIRVPPDISRELDAIAKEQGTTKSALARGLMMFGLEHYRQGAPLR